MTDYPTSDPDVSRAIRSWLHEDRHEDASRLAGVVLDLVEATPRRRSTWWSARRTPLMNRIVTIGLTAAAAVALVVIVGAQMFGSPTAGQGSQATPTLEPTPTAEPTPEPTPTPEAGLPEGRFEFQDSYSGVGMTVTIPAPGWTFGEPTFFHKGEERDNMPEAGILFWGQPEPLYIYGDPCRATSTKPETPVATVEEIAAALAAQASRDASEPVDVTIGGYDGKRLTLHTPDDVVPRDCELDEFAMYGTDDDPLGRYNQGPGQIDELWILDVDGTVVIIDATSRPDSRAELVDEMHAIVESTTFKQSD